MQTKPDFKAGDVLGFRGDGLISDFINVVTFGSVSNGLSHVAIVAPWHGDLLVFESTTLDLEPCVIQGKPVSGVQAHPLHSYEAYNGRVFLYSALKPVDASALEAFVGNVIGRPYDTFGAFNSGGFGLRAAILPVDLRTLFCSELVAAAMSTAGEWKCSNPSALNPNHLVRDAIREGVIGKPVRLK